MQRPVNDCSLASSTTVIVEPIRRRCLPAVPEGRKRHPDMRRKGNPYDNALAESFVATPKTKRSADSIAPTDVQKSLVDARGAFDRDWRKDPKHQEKP